MANLPIVGCMTPLSIMQDVWDSLGLYLNPKVLKSEKKRPSCGQFITGGWVIPVSIMQDVWDPLGLHLNRKKSKIGQETAGLRSIYQWEVA